MDKIETKRLKYQHLNEELVGKFSVEVAILSRVRHRNVVAFVGAVTEQPNLCVVLEFMEAGSLHELIHKRKTVLQLPRLLQASRLGSASPSPRGGDGEFSGARRASRGIPRSPPPTPPTDPPIGSELEATTARPGGSSFGNAKKRCKEQL